MESVLERIQEYSGTELRTIEGTIPEQKMENGIFENRVKTDRRKQNGIRKKGLSENGYKIGRAHV